MNTLIITLPPGSATSATVFDYVQSQDGQTALAHSRCAAALLPALGNGAGEIVARIPAALIGSTLESLRRSFSRYFRIT